MQRQRHGHDIGAALAKRQRGRLRAHDGQFRMRHARREREQVGIAVEDDDANGAPETWRGTDQPTREVAAAAAHVDDQEGTAGGEAGGHAPNGLQRERVAAEPAVEPIDVRE